MMCSEHVDPAGDSEFEDENPRPDLDRPERLGEPDDAGQGERSETMNGKTPEQRAAREARKAAERAREFAGLFEEYADCLLAPGTRERARTLCTLGKSKLAEMKEAVSDCEDWVRLAEQREDARTVGASA